MLGPLEVVDGDVTVDLGGPKQRAALAYLLVQRGDAVSAAQMVEDLWAAEPPRTVAGTLQTYISRLRRALGRDVIESVGTGYRIDLGEHLLDEYEFETHLRERAALGR